MIKINEEQRQLYRLEDFIEIAREGKKVNMDIELKKLPVMQEVNIDEVDGSHDKIQTYVLIAYYTFRIGDQVHRLSKVYMFATAGESLNSLRQNKNIANARLQMDYDRLKAANINIEKKFF